MWQCSACSKYNITSQTTAVIWLSGKLSLRKLPPRKFPPGKITPNETPSSLINHTNERKNKITNFFGLKKAVQYNILINITKVLFDTQIISQKILGLDNFYTDWKKSKNLAKVKISKWHLLASCKNRTKIRQSNYKI